MLNKYSLPSLGLIALVVTLLASGWFISWIKQPMAYEKAPKEESLGHKFLKEGNTSEALKHFLRAAQIDDDNISTSRRYLYVATASSNEEDKTKYFQLALKYNPDNHNASRELKALTQEVRYLNRYPDGWSQGISGNAIVNVPKEKYTLNYHTGGAQKSSNVVRILINGSLYAEQKITSNERYSKTLELAPGKHNIKLEIDDSFNPKKSGMSQDSRDLGVYFEVKRQVANE